MTQNDQAHVDSRTQLDPQATGGKGAPDAHEAMLAALEDTLHYWTSIGFAACDAGCDCIVDVVRAAIAKGRA